MIKRSGRMKVKIEDRLIGEDESCFIIAEVGANFWISSDPETNFKQALKLIDIASEVRADAVKFQTYSADTLYSRNAPRLSEMDRLVGKEETPYSLIKKIQMPMEWIGKLAKYSKKKHIIFMSTPFDEEAVDQLDKFVPAFKVSGYDIDNFDLLNKITEKKKPIILSTGASYFGEVEEAVNMIYSFNKNAEVVLLHCVNQYPTQFTDVNLRAMVKMKDYFNLPVGLSDHTLGIEIPIAAVSLGANIIEKHFTLDRSLPGPDHSFAAEPKELRKMVESVRKVEKALGDGVKNPAESELENRRLARRSIHAKKNIKKGEIIREEQLVMLRPALGIKPNFKQIVVGRKAKKNIKAGSMITWEMI